MGDALPPHAHSFPLCLQPEIRRYRKSISVKPIKATINHVEPVYRFRSNSLLASVYVASGLRNLDNLISPSPCLTPLRVFALAP
jgi:hypothetical protein